MRRRNVPVWLVVAIGTAACGYPSLPKLDPAPAEDAGPDDGAPDATAPQTPLGTTPIVVLQRASRNDPGDVFQYTSYKPGARLVMLAPATHDGVRTTLCCDAAGPEFASLDISGYDISFDARTIVFSAKLTADQRYGLFQLSLADGQVTQMATDPQRDYVSPIFLPGGRILFVSNAVDEPGAAQFQDEYERGTTSQLGVIGLDGTGLVMGPRNLSHRTAPSLASDGRVIFTQWDHLGGENAGHLMFVDQQMQNLHEAFGKEGKGASNTALKAREISPGRFVAVATARARTLTAGALIDIRLGEVEDHDGVISAPTHQAEAVSSYRALTPDVPLDDAPSPVAAGRYYDAFPLDARDQPTLLVSWASGPVEASVLDAAGQVADFGVYLYDSEHHTRTPILDDAGTWDVAPRPLAPRPPPAVIGESPHATLGGQTLIGSLNVYDSTLRTFQPGEIFGVRVMEGFSSEEGFPSLFGATRFEGHASLGIAPVAGDGSWSATIPANVPVHVQPVDRFGMSLFEEPVWFSGRAGEALVCGGCHEDRTRPPTVSAAQIENLRATATPMFGTTPRIQRLNTAPHAPLELVGVGWDSQVQPVLDAHCASCHNGVASAANPSYTITDATTGSAVTWTFDLRGGTVPFSLAVFAGGAVSRSYFSLAGPDLEAVERAQVLISGNFQQYANPTDAHNSLAIKLLNPTQLLPVPNAQVRAFPGTQPHLPAVGQPDLSAQEFYTLILAIDMGLNFYARENKPGGP